MEILTFSRKQGIEAIIKLQAMGGITETKEQAGKGWDNLTDAGKAETESVYNTFFTKKL